MNPPDRQLRVLIIEDSEPDAALLELELERAGYAPRCQRVETTEAMTAALEGQAWDLIVADYVLPHFSGLLALDLVKRRGLDVPFIIVSGHITDDTAVAAMKAGAHDYVMKDNLKRLGSAVGRELREAEERRERRRSEATLKREQTFREAIENSVPSGITAVDLDGRQTYVNPAFSAMVGWGEAELVGATAPFVYWPPEEIAAITEALGRLRRSEAPASGLELRFRRKSGERIDVLVQTTALRDHSGRVTGWVSSASDITERKRAEMRLAAEHAITRILAHTPSLDQAAPGILQVLLEALEVEVGLLWILEPDGRVLRPAGAKLRTSGPPLDAFLQERSRLRLGSGEQLAGQVWKEGHSVWQPDWARSASPRTAITGLTSAVAFPIQSAGDFLGVLEFLAVRRLDQDLTLQNMMLAIGSEIGQFIQRRSAEEALRRARDELEIRVQQRTADLKLANARLQTAIAERERLEHELLEITEKERRRIALDLHDDLGQKLSGIALMAKGLELKVTKEAKCRDLGAEAAQIYELVQEAISHTSHLAHDLATLDFQEHDLPVALRELATRAKRLFGIACLCKIQGAPPPLAANSVRQLYKIAQEAVTNAIKHGKAKQVTITLTTNSEQLVLKVRNNGLPFPDLRSHTTGMGLRIMNYRASLIGGTLDVKGLKAMGTVVTCALPRERQ